MEHQEKVIKDFPTYSITADGFVVDLRLGTKSIGHFSGGYRRINLFNPTYPNGKLFFIHRLIAEAFLENPNQYDEVDHIDRNPSNNNITNLRWCNHNLNQQNKGTPKNNTSGYKNIGLSNGSWRVQIRRDKKNLLYKRAQTLEEAIKIRNDFFVSIGEPIPKDEISSCNHE